MGLIKAVILDIDGTLLLSNDQHAMAFLEAANALGIPANYSRIRRLIGKGGDKLIPQAFGVSAESETGRKLGDLKSEIFREHYVPHLQPAPGARALLERLKQDGLTLVVGTSADKDVVKRLLERAGVLDLVDDIVTADDVDKSKPDPDIVHAAIDKSGEDKSNVLMIGDTPYDVESARRAGIPILAVRCGGWSDKDLSDAAAIYDDPGDLLARSPEIRLWEGEGSSAA